MSVDLPGEGGGMPEVGVDLHISLSIQLTEI